MGLSIWLGLTKMLFWRTQFSYWNTEFKKYNITAVSFKHIWYELDNCIGIDSKHTQKQNQVHVIVCPPNHNLQRTLMTIINIGYSK